MGMSSVAEVANTQLLSYQTFFDTILKPYRFIRMHVSIDLCKTENEKVMYSELGSRVYIYGLRQKVWFQFILLLSIVSFFGFISLFFSFHGTIALFLIRYVHDFQNKKSKLL